MSNVKQETKQSEFKYVITALSMLDQIEKAGNEFFDNM